MMTARVETFAGKLGFALALWLSLLAASMPSFAQGTSNGPESYFHGAASKYIEGRHQEAKLQVEEGLRLFPENADLKRLAMQLNKLEEQKQQQQQQEQDGGDRQEEQDPSQDSTEQQPQSPEEQEQEKEQKPEEQPDSNKADADTSSGEESPSDTSQAPQPQPGEMSEEEAKRLLDAYKDDEKEVQEKLQDRRGKSPRVEKDW